MFKEKLKALMKSGYFVEFRPDVAQPDRRMILSVYKEEYWHRTLINFYDIDNGGPIDNFDLTMDRLLDRAVYEIEMRKGKDHEQPV